MEVSFKPPYEVAHLERTYSHTHTNSRQKICSNFSRLACRNGFEETMMIKVVAMMMFLISGMTQRGLMDPIACRSIVGC